ncbi:toxic anion resistance protein [Acinetobacter sp. VNH17]|uniref:Toxic anion resistance protein n=1 Tax=Acinetobacter thutiue TaxID=2998078 RepID=A0ABT7WT36_9GAMM|nr:toxic anion resistance protein [Acinetobacter thutiue]MCY6413726.1 toxic anion resistance protein [Acinetobacter thutiue]MDN0015835.1 toxic anion resistance protein [Acinetobacter thutiue]
MTKLQLTPPEPLPLINNEQINDTVQIKPEVIENLNQQIEDFLHHLIELPSHEKTFQDKVNTLHQLGQQSVKKSSGLSHRLLSRSLNQLDDDAESQNISHNLIELRQTLEALNPAQNQKFFAIRKFLRLLPIGNRVEDYFDKYKSSEEHINVILSSLDQGKDELIKDNIALERDKRTMWETMQELEQYSYIGKQLSQKIEYVIDEISLTDEHKARVLKEEVLFYLKQKVTDLMTQQAVSVQAYMSLDLIRNNNLELIKGVDRALMTTVSALQTAMVVAQALSNQKLVLNQVKLINSTTEDLIVSTSKMLNQQTRDIQSQSANSVISVEKLQTAFNQIFDTIDLVNDFKVKSLPNLQQSMDHLSTQLQRAQQYTDQVRKNEVEQQLKLKDIHNDGIAKIE